MSQPLSDLLVVSLEQAVAAPFLTCRMADAGARVIKLERADGAGDFARGYDKHALGMSSYFVWLNRGKESLAIDIKQPDDMTLLHRLLAKAALLQLLSRLESVVQKMMDCSAREQKHSLPIEQM